MLQRKRPNEDAGGELGLATPVSIDPADQGRPAVRSSE
jgi:hypothetical protein